MIYSDDVLMAYADGELPPDQMTAIAAAEQADAAIAARIALFTQSRHAVSAAFAVSPAQGSDPMAALVRRLDQATAPPAEASNVVTLQPRRPVLSRTILSRPVPLWQLSAAASLAFAVGLSFALSGAEPATTDIAHLVIGPSDSLARALDTVPAGVRQTVALGEVEVIGSFTTADGEFCREFELDAADNRTVVSVACRDQDAWDLRLAVAAASDASGYAPASSLDALDAWLDATDASEPMSTEEEAVVLGSLQ